MDKPDRPPSSGASPGDVPSAADRSAVPEATAVEITEGRTERIAVMRHELAHLQLQLIDAQQRVAAEMQGRAEDADRLEELEARVQEQEVKAREDAARIAQLTTASSDLRARFESASHTIEELRREQEASEARSEESRKKHRELTEQLETHVASLHDTKTMLAAQDAELATKLAERDSERATRIRLESELEASLGKHRELTDLIETHASSLRETKALLADRETELASRTSERDAQQETRIRLEGELGEARRALDAGRARAQELARHIATLGQELDAVATGEPAGSAAPPSTSSTPPRRPPAGLEAALVEAHAIEAAPPAELAPSRARGLILVLGGLAVGVAGTFAAIELRGAKEKTATRPAEIADAPPAPQPPPGAVSDTQPTAPATAAKAQPAAASDASPSVAAPSADDQRTGIIVLPPEAEGHRVFVDGRPVQPTSGRLEVPCGKHEFQIGSRGEPRSLEVACGGETVLP